MIDAQQINDTWSLAGNTVVGAALLVSVILFLKFLREERAANAADRAAEREERERERAAEREDRAIARREYTQALAELGQETRAGMTDLAREFKKP